MHVMDQSYDSRDLIVVSWFRRVAFNAGGRRALSATSIETADEHGTPVAIEPGLDAVAHMGRAIDPSILVMRNTDFLPLDVSDQVRATLQGLHLADYGYRGRLPDTLGNTLLLT